MGVPEAIERHFDRVAGHATPLRQGSTMTEGACSVMTMASDASKIDETIALGVGHIIASYAIGNSLGCGIGFFMYPIKIVKKVLPLIRSISVFFPNIN